MRLIEDLSDFPSDLKTIVTSGTFDGVHLGHQKILKAVAEKAKSRGLVSVVLTYWPHPRFVLHQNDDSLKLLSTFDEKASLMADCGIDYLVRIPFTKEFSEMEPDLFVDLVLRRHLNIQYFIIGYDHHFGKDRKGNLDFLKEKCQHYGFEIEEIPRHEIDDIGVSSTEIRNCLLKGQISSATHLLGRPYSISGEVIHGSKKGRDLGFPTANVWVPESFKLVPSIGSYACFVECEEGMHEGMVNIGVRPTVDGTKLQIEANIFNFDKELYGQDLTLHFIERLRDEIKFSSVEELRHQLMEDKEHSLEILRNENV